MERQIALSRSAPLRALYEEVSGYPAGAGPQDAGAGVAAVVAAGAEPEPGGGAAYIALPLLIEHDGHLLSFVSSIATFNTPMDVTVAELAIETLLPADAATAKYLRSLGP